MTMPPSPIKLVWNKLSEVTRASFGEELVFICIGKEQGKSTFIRHLGVDYEREVDGVTNWATTIDNTILKFIEYPSPSVVPLFTRSKCILLLFSKLLREQTGIFHKEVREAKKLSDDLQCPILLVHTFCDQNSFPISFVQNVQKEFPQLTREKEIMKIVFNRWRNNRDTEVMNIVGKGINSTCSYFSFSKTGNIAIDKTMIEDIIEKLNATIIGDILPRPIDIEGGIYTSSDEDNNEQKPKSQNSGKLVFSTPKVLGIGASVFLGATFFVELWIAAGLGVIASFVYIFAKKNNSNK